MRGVCIKGYLSRDKGLKVEGEGGIYKGLKVGGGGYL